MNKLERFLIFLIPVLVAVLIMVLYYPAPQPPGQQTVKGISVNAQAPQPPPAVDESPTEDDFGDMMNIFKTATTFMFGGQYDESADPANPAPAAGGGSTQPAPGGTTPAGSLPTAPIAQSETVDVRGITVFKGIATQTEALLAAAAAAGLSLSGSGWRDINDQIALRRQNCGSTDYDIYQRPSSECSPQTARPGSSNHEKGLAIDFTCNGGPMRAGDSCFVWMTTNAAKYGFYNLPSESWHWSTDGH
jgi:hypothetical protein